MEAFPVIPELSADRAQKISGVTFLPEQIADRNITDLLVQFVVRSGKDQRIDPPGCRLGSRIVIAEGKIILFHLIQVGRQAGRKFRIIGIEKVTIQRLNGNDQHPVKTGQFRGGVFLLLRKLKTFFPQPVFFFRRETDLPGSILQLRSPAPPIQHRLTDHIRCSLVDRQDHMPGIVFFKSSIHFPIPDIVCIADQRDQKKGHQTHQRPVVTRCRFDIPARLNTAINDPPENCQRHKRSPDVIILPDHRLDSFMIGMLIQHHKGIISQRHEGLRVKNDRPELDQQSKA